MAAGAVAGTVVHVLTETPPRLPDGRSQSTKHEAGTSPEEQRVGLLGNPANVPLLIEGASLREVLTTAVEAVIYQRNTAEGRRVADALRKYPLEKAIVEFVEHKRDGIREPFRPSPVPVTPIDRAVESRIVAIANLIEQWDLKDPAALWVIDEMLATFSNDEAEDAFRFVGANYPQHLYLPGVLDLLKLWAEEDFDAAASYVASIPGARRGVLYRNLVAGGGERAFGESLELVQNMEPGLSKQVILSGVLENIPASASDSTFEELFTTYLSEGSPDRLTGFPRMSAIGSLFSKLAMRDPSFAEALATRFETKQAYDRARFEIQWVEAMSKAVKGN